MDGVRTMEDGGGLGVRGDPGTTCWLISYSHWVTGNYYLLRLAISINPYPGDVSVQCIKGDTPSVIISSLSPAKPRIINKNQSMPTVHIRVITSNLRENWK